jgi:hypothetical protein
MRKRTPVRWAQSTLHGHIAIAVYFILFGCLGFLYFQRINKDVGPDYFDVYSNEFSKNMKIVFDIARVAMAFSLLFKVPVDCLVSVSSIRKLRRRYLRINILRKSENAHSGDVSRDGYKYSVVGSEEGAAAAAPAGAGAGEYDPEYVVPTGGKLSPKFMPPEGHTDEWRQVPQRERISTHSTSQSQSPIGDRHHAFVVSDLDTRDSDIVPSHVVRGSDISDTTRTSAATTVRHAAWTPDRRVAEKSGRLGVSNDQTLSLSGHSLLEEYRANTYDTTCDSDFEDEVNLRLFEFLLNLCSFLRYSYYVCVCSSRTLT